jgi:catechol 2,3-dioxygenase-like lactoylglutathione lyase family enzyme
MNEPLETALFSDADHFMIFSKNKEAVVAAYQDKLGFNLKYGGRNDSFGYENYIIGFGLVYLEILSLFDWKAGLANGMISGELADLFENRKALCLTYAMRTEQIDELANRVNQHGLEAIGPLSMERKRPDGKIPKWKLCLPGGITFRRAQIPFFVQWMTDDLERLSWEEPVSHPNGAVAITGFSIAVKDLNSVRKIYEDSFGCELYGEFDIRELNARCARYRVGQVFIDLISPSGEGPVKQFIEEVGDGPFEIKFKVEDINQTAAFFSKQKIKAEKEVIAENRLLVDDISLFGIRILFA